MENGPTKGTEHSLHLLLEGSRRLIRRAILAAPKLRLIVIRTFFICCYAILFETAEAVFVLG
jgi:hypothetical protein